jgi:predicted RNase H-like nuclease (RuvC/YqgF family)
VRYEAVNAMLLNEFLKVNKKVETQGRKIEELESTIAELRSTVAQQKNHFKTTTAQQQKEIQALIAGLKEQAAEIQNVNAKLELRRSAPRLVVGRQ